ncbi:MAG: acyl-CoA thioester hydrolase/BAAT C-terminal domain-containing protein, partial [Pseudomonadota bacterium]
VIWEGWGAGKPVSSFSWRGEALPYVPYKGMDEHFARLGRGEESYIRTPHDDGRIAHPERIAPARIEVERIDEPVFIVGGHQDRVWASGPMSEAIKHKRESVGLPTVAIISEDASHFLSGHPYRPLNEADALVRREAFPALIAFYETHLKP